MTANTKFPLRHWITLPSLRRMGAVGILLGCLFADGGCKRTQPDAPAADKEAHTPTPQSPSVAPTRPGDTSPKDDGSLGELAATRETRNRYVEASFGDPSNTWHKFYQDLEKRYRGKIDTSARGEASDRSLQEFLRLMREWMPLGFDVDELKAIAAPPTEESPDSITYHFPGTMYGGGYRFRTRNKIIIAVEAVH